MPWTRRAIKLCARGRSSVACVNSWRGVTASVGWKASNGSLRKRAPLALVGTKDQGVRVRFQFDPAVDLVLVDKVQIQQVLLNLLRNAVEAMAASQRRELVISTATGDGDMVVVSVADTGSGIAPELMSQLFQPF